jgi:signal transduction histidine kinase
VDVVTPDARRRRARQSFKDRFDAASRLVADSADRKGIRIENAIPSRLKSPPMFPAELTTVFSNLLTNAVKAAGNEGMIRAVGEVLESGDTSILIENTGVSVQPAEGERWFRPFESTTSTLDPILGQGMGLGLPITRSMLDEYGAEIRFVKPQRGFCAALELLFPRD